MQEIEFCQGRMSLSDIIILQLLVGGIEDFI